MEASPTPGPAPQELELELALFRKGVESMRAARPVCCVCSRRPLVGETATVFAGRSAERCVCATCLRTNAARKLGPPLRQQLIRPDAGTVTLRRAA